MIYVISGTNRKNSVSLKVARWIENEIRSLGNAVEIIDLASLPLEVLHAGNYEKEKPTGISEVIAKLNKAEGLYFVVPEYNGSFPGILKYFIDYFSYPETFEYRPVAFTGLGWRWGGLRPVEQLQQVFNYRNAFIYPERIFINNAPNIVQDNAINDESITKLLQKQIKGFMKFIHALKTEGIDANSVNSKK